MNGKPLPVLNSDEEAERFVDEADLSEYDLSGGRWLRLHLRSGLDGQIASAKLVSGDLERATRNAQSQGTPLDAYLGQLVHESLRRQPS